MKSGPHELAQYRATQIDAATNAEWKKERRMTRTENAELAEPQTLRVEFNQKKLMIKIVIKISLPLLVIV